MPDFNPIDSWFSLASSLPKDAPDELYDAQREKFFESSVLPWAFQQGYGEQTARQEFLAKTARPGKSSFPRTAVTATSALASFAAPLPEGALGDRIKRAKAAAVGESEKQGISTVLPEMAGQMIGETPYWVAGLEAAGMASGAVKGIRAVQQAGGMGPITKASAEALSSKTMLDRVAATAAGAMIQGTYDAAKSEDGRALQEGALGAVLGGVGTAAFEFAGPLWHSLRGVKPSISEVEAKAVEAVAKGSATEAQQVLAEQVVADGPELAAHVKSWVSHQVQQAKKNGVPKNAPEVEYNGRVKISIRTAEG